jgi:hypothetical protein
MIKQSKILFLMLPILLMGCSPSNQELYEQVMAVHDEVMPKMDDLYKLKRELQQIQADSTAIPANQQKALEEAIVKIDAASEGMMVWMREFDPPKGMAEADLKKYLMEQMEKVKKVKEDILEALKSGNEFKKFKIEQSV